MADEDNEIVPEVEVNGTAPVDCENRDVEPPIGDWAKIDVNVDVRLEVSPAVELAGRLCRKVPVEAVEVEIVLLVDSEMVDVVLLKVLVDNGVASEVDKAERMLLDLVVVISVGNDDCDTVEESFVLIETSGLASAILSVTLFRTLTLNVEYDS